MSATPRLQLISIFAAYGTAGVYWGALVASLPALQAISGLSAGGFGFLLTVQTIGGILAMQALGRVMHRVQAWAIPISSLLYGVGTLLLAFASGPWSLGLALFIAGGSSGALDISLNMRVARLETDLNRSLFNRVHALFPFVMLLSSASTGLLREAGATPAMLFPPIALLILASAVLEARAGGHQRPMPRRTGGARVRLRGILLILGALAAMGAVMEGGAHTWSAIYMEGGLLTGPALAGLASAAITLGLTSGRLIAHRLERHLRDMVILRLFALIAIPAFAILAFIGTPEAALFGFFLAGMGIGPVEPSVFRSVAKRYDEADRGQALALATGLAYLGYLSAPPVLGRVIEAVGWAPMFAGLGLLAFAAVALTYRVPPAS